MQYERMTLETQSCFSYAHELAVEYKDSFIDVEHFLFVLLSLDEIQSFFLSLNIEIAILLSKLEEIMESKSSNHKNDTNSLNTLNTMYISQDLIRVSELAIKESTDLGSSYVTPLHFVLAISRQPGTEANRILKSYGASYSLLRNAFVYELTENISKNTASSNNNITNTNSTPSNNLKTTIANNINSTNQQYIQPNTNSSNSSNNNVSTSISANRIISNNEPPKTRRLNSKPSYDAINKFGSDLTERASLGKLDPVIGRENEIRRLIQILSRRSKNNPCLIGEPGVGKTAVVEGLAQRIVDGDVPEGLREKRIISVELSSILAGASHQGEFEQRMKALVDEVVSFQGKLILFIDEIHILTGIGGQGSIDAANLLKPALARGEFRCIGATTIDEYRKHIEKDSALERRFQPITVQEPTLEDTISILRGLKEHYEFHHGVRIQDRALVAAAKLSQRYIMDRFLPDKAIDLIDEAAAKIRVELDSSPAILDSLERKLMQLEVEKQALSKEDDNQSRVRLANIMSDITNCREEVALLRTHWLEEKSLILRLREVQEEIAKNRLTAERALREHDLPTYVKLEQNRQDLHQQISEIRELFETLQNRQRLLREEVSDEDIAEIVSKWTKIPISKMMETEIEKLINLESRLRTRIVGQDDALKKVANSLRRSKTGLSEPDRPYGSFIFMGQTGVGKTELAKALADLWYNDPKALLRFDMSEYMERHAVARLLGSPPGYIGYEEGSILSKAMRERPYCVVLFDEIEKAHPDIFNILLQIVEDGRLTDNHGKRIDFRNTLVILTTNIGSYDKEIKNSQNLTTLSSPTSFLPKDLIPALLKTFRPELINRIDEIILFQPLGYLELQSILELQLHKLDRLLNPYGITLECTSLAKKHIISEGFEPSFGARSLNRVVQRLLKDPLSTFLLEHQDELKGKIIVDAHKSGEKLIFKKAV